MLTRLASSCFFSNLGPCHPAVHQLPNILLRGLLEYVLTCIMTVSRSDHTSLPPEPHYARVSLLTVPAKYRTDKRSTCPLFSRCCKSTLQLQKLPSSKNCSLFFFLPPWSKTSLPSWELLSTYAHCHALHHVNLTTNFSFHLAAVPPRWLRYLTTVAATAA